MARVRCTSLVGFALAIALLASPAGAQEKKGAGGGGGRPGGGFGGFMGGGGLVTRLTLVGREQVANEIKVTPEEKKKLEELQKDIPAFGRGSGGSKDLSQEERRKQATEAMEKRTKALAEAEKKLDGILTPEQSKRLEEIYIQQRGVQALKDEKVAKALKLSEEQIGKIDGAIKWGQEEQTKLRPAGGGGRPTKDEITEIQEKQQKLRKEVDDKILASLTDAQKQDFEKMKGSPFTLERSNQKGSRGGQGGGGNGKGGKDA